MKDGDTTAAPDDEGVAKMAAEFMAEALGPEPEGGAPQTLDEMIAEAGFEEAKAYWALVDAGEDPAHLDELKAKIQSGKLPTAEQREAFARIYASLFKEGA